jgi:large subunit ribosomal protein L25
MEIKTLQTSIKKDNGTLVSKRHRKSGQIPAVLYGHKQECLMLLLDKKEFSRAFDSGMKMVALKWDSSEEKALIKDVQYDTFGNEILHVDFIRVALTEKITTQVPIVLYGNSPGVKEGGILGHAMKEAEIECLPTEIPENIRVDVSGVNIGDAIHVEDLELTSNFKVLGSPDAVVVSVHFATEEKEASEEESSAEPEVITARKPDEDKEAENKG